MEYAILDELKEASDERLERFLASNPNIYAKSNIFECEEPFEGSDPNMKLYIYSNYMSRTGLINLGIIIREIPREGVEEVENKEDVLTVRTDVETSIFPIYLSKTPVYDMPEKLESPEITEARAKFIIDKRALPKKKADEQFDCTKHRWNVNMIASELNMSNRLVAQYCKANNL